MFDLPGYHIPPFQTPDLSTKQPSTRFKQSFLRPILPIVLLHRFNILVPPPLLHPSNDISQRKNSDNRHTRLPPDLPNSTPTRRPIIPFSIPLALTRHLLLPVNSHHNTDQLPTLRINNLYGLPDGFPRGHHIINNNYAFPLQTLTNQQATLPVVFDFLTIKRIPYIAPLRFINTGQFLGCGGAKRDPLICWSEEDVEREVLVLARVRVQGSGVRGADGADEFCATEEAAVDEVRAYAAGF